MRVDPLCERVIFLPVPATLELGAVLALLIQLKIERVLQRGKFRRTDRIFRQNRGNDDNPMIL